MNAPTQIYGDVCVGEVIWPKFLQANHGDQQLRELTQLADSAGKGMILDCSMVEVGNSEIVNLLMRVRNYAKKKNKEIALFNVPETLSETLRLCKLQSVVRSANDAGTAKKLVCDLAQGKGALRIWIESHLVLAILLAICLCVIVGLVGYLSLG